MRSGQKIDMTNYVAIIKRDDLSSYLYTEFLLAEISRINISTNNDDSVHYFNFCFSGDNKQMDGWEISLGNFRFLMQTHTYYLLGS